LTDGGKSALKRAEPQGVWPSFVIFERWLHEIIAEIAKLGQTPFQKAPVREERRLSQTTRLQLLA